MKPSSEPIGFNQHWDTGSTLSASDGEANLCGVVAELRFDGTEPDSQVHQRQLASLEHRGPDALGSFRSGPLVLGQTRLRVMDLNHGDPPIGVQDNAVVVALNGEIYNHRELRDELVSKGHHFRTRTDTEVLAALLIEFEPLEVLQRIEGMFAFAAWNHRERNLILARDRLGQKPLYCSHQRQSVVVASEIGALLMHPEVSSDLDLTQIPNYLSYGYFRSPKTFYREIQSLEAGHFATVNEAGDFTARPYWEIPSPRVLDLPTRDLIDLTRKSVRDAVLSSSNSDASLGTFLSGGLDSSIVTGVLATESDVPISTFTVGFEDQQGFDERPFARTVAEHFATEHHEIIVKPDAEESIHTILDSFGQPFADSSALPTYFLSQWAAQHVTVAMSGDGGDEVFGGYPRYAYGDLTQRLLPFSPLFSALTRLSPGKTTGVGGGINHRLNGLSRALRSGLPDAYRHWISYLPDEAVLALSGPPGAPDWQLSRDLYASSSPDSTVTRLMKLDLVTYLPNDLLVKADRMAMANSLEVRNPFLNHHLVNFSLSLPSRSKVRNFKGKWILRQAFADMLPTTTLQRSKHGFGIPLDRWLRTSLKPLVNSSFGQGSFVRALLQTDALDRIVHEHESGAANHGHAVWTLLMLELFLRRSQYSVSDFKHV